MVNYYSICVSLNLHIVNGRWGKDEGVGEFTCFIARGQSDVDYLIVSTALFDDIKESFVVPSFFSPNRTSIPRRR